MGRVGEGVWRYAKAVLATAVAAGVGVCLNSALDYFGLAHHPLPFSPVLFVAVVWTAWYCGLGPALLASVLGGIAVAAMMVVKPIFDVRLPGVEVLVAYFIATLTTALFVDGQKRAQRVIERAEAERRLIDENMPVGICRIDPDGRFLETNSRMSEITGYSRPELLAQHLQDLFHSQDRAPSPEFFEQLRSGSIPFFDREERLVQRDGTVIWANLGIVAGSETALAVVQDITREKQAEERLRNQQKLESIGLLAAGIAHDFNNVMTTVLGFASLVRDRALAGSRDYRDLNTIITAAEHAADLTRQLLAYAGKGQFISTEVNVSEIVRKTEILLRPSLDERVELSFELTEDLPRVLADPTQVQQLIANLVINSAEAIDEREGVAVVIRTGIRSFGEHACPEPSIGELAPGEYIMLEVQDDGVGMNDMTMSQMFDPFFSTKFTGRGLGLAAVSGIVRSLRGAIIVSTEPDRGTTITVLLPPAPAARATEIDTSMTPLKSA